MRLALITTETKEGGCQIFKLKMVKPYFVVLPPPVRGGSGYDSLSGYESYAGYESCDVEEEEGEEEEEAREGERVEEEENQHAGMYMYICSTLDTTRSRMVRCPYFRGIWDCPVYGGWSTNWLTSLSGKEKRRVRLKFCLLT